jgi:hypothetical protein
MALKERVAFAGRLGGGLPGRAVHISASAGVAKGGSMSSTIIREPPVETPVKRQSSTQTPAPASTPPIRQPTWQRLILLIVLGYEVLGCLSGGILLVAAPDGHLMDMPLEGIGGFFPDFFVPGLFLIGLGILNLAAFIAVWRRTRTDWLLAGLALGGLTVWFLVEIAVVGTHWLQAMWGLPVVMAVVMALPLIPSRTEGRPFIQSHPVLTYYILTFAISWGGILLVIFGGRSSVPATPEQFDRLIPMAILALLAGPPLACLLLTAPVAFASASLAMSLVSPAYLPTILTRTDTASVLLLGTLPALLVGSGEELGWTGFAIPRLLRRYSVLATGLIAGVLWGAWHVLTNDVWAGNVIAGELPVPLIVSVNALLLLVGELLVYRVLMVWVYDRTGSLPVAIVMHAGFAFGTFALQPNGVSGVALLVHAVLVSALLWLVVATVARRGQFERQALRTQVA